MTDCNDFITRQLATTGWAPIHPGLAKFLCPKLHSEHGISAWLTVTGVLLKRFPRTELVKAQIDGFGVVPILTRSVLALAERIAFVTGGQVDLVVEGGEDQAQQPRKAPAVAQGNPPRYCRQCDNLTAGHCLPAMRGEWPEGPQQFRPDTSRPRRCPHYKPEIHLLTGEHRDYRDGRTLWPELIPKPEVAAAEPEPAGALDKACVLIKDLLKSPRASVEAIKAAEDAGISSRTMQRASETLCVVKSKDGHGGWTWALPAEQGANMGNAG